MKVFNLKVETVPGGIGALVHPGQYTMSVDLATIAESNGGVRTINNGDADVHGFGTMGSATSVVYSGWNGCVGSGGWDEESFTITNPMAGQWTIIVDNEQATEIDFGIFFNEPARTPDLDDVQVAPHVTSVSRRYSLGFYEVDTIALGLSANVMSSANALATIDSVEASLLKLTNHQADDASKMAELQRMIDETDVQTMNQASMQSKLQDTDFSKEISSLSKSVVISQAAISIINSDIGRLKSAVDILLD